MEEYLQFVIALTFTAKGAVGHVVKSCNRRLLRTCFLGPQYKSSGFESSHKVVTLQIVGVLAHTQQLEIKVAHLALLGQILKIVRLILRCDRKSWHHDRAPKLVSFLLSRSCLQTMFSLKHDISFKSYGSVFFCLKSRTSPVKITPAFLFITSCMPKDWVIRLSVYCKLRN